MNNFVGRSDKLIQALKRSCNLNCVRVRQSTNDFVLSWKQTESPPPPTLEREVSKFLDIDEAMDHVNSGSLGRMYSYKSSEVHVIISFVSRTIYVGNGNE